MTLLEPVTSALDIPGTWNARDVGGRATPQGSAEPLRTGKLLRTATLSMLTDAGVSVLESLGVTTVVDLRGQDEIDRDGPDRLPKSAQWERRPMDPQGAASSADGAKLIEQLLVSKDPHAARGIMDGVYRTFVSDATIRAQIGRTLHDVASAPGAAVVHCSAGKDRTGWIVALVQYLCGVDEDARVAEYMLSADGVRDLAAQVPPIPGLDLEVMLPLLSVEPQYLGAAWDRAVEEFGSIDAYLKACGVETVVRDTIAGKLVG